MAIIRSHGITITDDVPVHVPTGQQSILAWNTNTDTLYYYDSGWSEMPIPVISDDVYGVGWDGNTDAASKNAIYDKIEAIVAGILPDGDYGDVTVSGSGTVITIKAGIDAALIADGSVSDAEFQYIGGLTSDAQTQLDAKALDTEVIHDTGNETVAGVKTFSDGIETLDDAYDATNWNGNNEVPTKNAVRDKIETLTLDNVNDGDKGDITVTGGVWTIDPLVDATLIADGSVTNTEFQYINSLTSNAQDQINTKADDSSVVHDTGDESVGGVKTFTSDPIIPDEVYGVAWNGVLEPPTKNAIYDEVETRAVDADVVHLAGAENITGVKTFTVDPVVPAEAYGVGWDGSDEVPTKNDVYDKIESITSDLPATVYHATIAQTGTSVPTVTFEHNTTGETVTPARSGVGLYTLGFTGTPLTTGGKTIVTGSIGYGATATAQCIRIEATDTSTISISITDSTNPVDVAGNISVKVEIYP